MSTKHRFLDSNFFNILSLSLSLTLLRKDGESEHGELSLLHNSWMTGSFTFLYLSLSLSPFSVNLLEESCSEYDVEEEKY